MYQPVREYDGIQEHQVIQDDMRAIAAALACYAADNERRLPDEFTSAGLAKAFIPDYLLTEDSLLRPSPSDRMTRPIARNGSYTLNAAAGGKALSELPDTTWLAKANVASWPGTEIAVYWQSGAFLSMIRHGDEWRVYFGLSPEDVESSRSGQTPSDQEQATDHER